MTSVFTISTKYIPVSIYCIVDANRLMGVLLEMILEKETSFYSKIVSVISCTD
jgi:hypothetical protein